MSKSIIGAQRAVIKLLDHFGIDTKSLRSVTITTESNLPVIVTAEYFALGKDGMPMFADRKYEVTEIAENLRYSLSELSDSYRGLGVAINKAMQSIYIAPTCRIKTRSAWDSFFKQINYKP